MFCAHLRNKVFPGWALSTKIIGPLGLLDPACPLTYLALKRSHFSRQRFHGFGEARVSAPPFVFSTKSQLEETRRLQVSSNHSVPSVFTSKRLGSRPRRNVFVAPALEPTARRIGMRLSELTKGNMHLLSGAAGCPSGHKSMLLAAYVL